MEKESTESDIKPQKNCDKLGKFEKSLGFKNNIKWDNLISIGLYHVFGVYWSYWYAFPVKWQTVVFGKIFF